MLINWGLESYKWKFLISPLEKISFLTAYKSIFAGVTVSIFMPNRIGEFAGRIFFLEKADKIEATLKNFIGSTIQFLITLLFGVIACFVFVERGMNNHINLDFFDLRIVKIILIISFLSLTALFILNKYRSFLSEKFQHYFQTIFDVNRKDLLIVFVISLIRYLVFLTQYYFVLIAFGIQTDFITAGVLIALTFLITSIVPSFALTEIVTRGAAAVFLFNTITDNSNGVIASSFVIWIINLAVPALIGSAFIWKLNFFK
jgi:hypothetical protein